MSQTAAARPSQASAPSLRDRLKDPSLLRDRCYIDGAWLGTPANPVTNPVNGVELAKVPKMSTAEATQAVEAAERAFPAWARLTAKPRSNLLRKWFDLIIANREHLALILTSDHGQPLPEALGERDIGRAYVQLFAGQARRVYGDTLPHHQPPVGLKNLGPEGAGNAAYVVFADADIDAAVEGAIASKYRNMGQTCVCANRIYAQEKIYDQFVQKRSKKVAAMKVGDGTEQGVTQGPLINMAAGDKGEKHTADPVKHGARNVTRGKRHSLGGTFFQP